MSKSPTPPERQQPERQQDELAAPKAQPISLPYRVAGLPTRKPTRFDLRNSAAERAAIAEDLGLLGLSRLVFKGEIRATGARDFVLEARLEAEFVQACSLSLAPVPGKIAETVRRVFTENWEEPDVEEIEMPEDDTIEPLPEVIDIGTVVIEALSLALPLYPRAEGVKLGKLVAAPEGAEEIVDEKLKPFAGLAALKAKLSGEKSDENE